MTLIRRPHSHVPTPQWAALATAVVTLLAVAVRVKLVRAMVVNPAAGWVEKLALLRSDIAFVAAYGFALALTLMLLHRLAGRLGRVLRGAFWVVQALLSLALMGTMLAADRYKQVTGTELNIERIRFSVGEMANLQEAILSELPAQSVAAGIALVVVVLVGPVLAAYAAHRRTTYVHHAHWWHSPVALGVAATLLWASWVPAHAQATPDVSRNAVVQMVGTEVSRQVRAARFRRAPDPAAFTADTVSVSPTGKRRNVVIVHLDGIRADVMGAYTKQKPSITPVLDALSAKSTRVEQAYTSVPHSSKAMVSVNCGVEPPVGIELRETATEGLRSRCLADVLDSQGYNTVFMQSAVGTFEDRADLVRNFGYRDFIPVESMPNNGYTWANYMGYEDDIMLAPSEDWLKDHQGAPFLATYVTATAHHDYKMPEGYQFKHLDDDVYKNKYLNAVNYVDAFVGKLIAQYKRLGLYDNTVFVFYGDHGEGFGEHGRNQHDATIYQEGVRVPLFVLDPKRPGRTVAGPATLNDVVPTVLASLGLTASGGSYRGLPIDKIPADRTVRMACYQDYYCMARVQNGIKYIDHFDTRPAEVYDLRTDPLEQHDLASSTLPTQQRAWRDDLLQWRSDVINRYGTKE